MCSLVLDDELKIILDLFVLVVLDEVYVEFVWEFFCINWVMNYENLIVLCIFSKCVGKKYCIFYFCVYFIISEIWKLNFENWLLNIFNGSVDVLYFCWVFFWGIVLFKYYVLVNNWFLSVYKNCCYLLWDLFFVLCWMI